MFVIVIVHVQQFEQTFDALISELPLDSLIC